MNCSTAPQSWATGLQQCSNQSNQPRPSSFLWTNS